VLVVTNVSNGKRAQQQREHTGKSLESIMDGMRKTVSEAFGLKMKLPVIDIDTMPVSTRTKSLAPHQ